MAQYSVGHLERLQRIEALRQKLPGLALAGNGYNGIGVPDCVRSGAEAAGKILAEMGMWSSALTSPPSASLVAQTDAAGSAARLTASLAAASLPWPPSLEYHAMSHENGKAATSLFRFSRWLFPATRKRRRLPKKWKPSIQPPTICTSIFIRLRNCLRTRRRPLRNLPLVCAASGYEVTEGVGGTGVVAILKNGAGPTVMLRTELDALPVEEKTGLPYASKVHAKDDSGRDVPVMHACGHDLHMAALVGTADIMAHSKQSWHGTLMLIGQPAEETISGAKRMIDDGLFTRFPKPTVGVALHVGNELPAGQVGITPGIYNTNADSLRITIYGKGGHGSAPHAAIDPIVIAARTILALQTIVSREVKPGEMAVITVGYIHAGTKNNIIPDQAELGLTVRTFKADVRKQILTAITRIAKAEALAGGRAAGASHRALRIDRLGITMTPLSPSVCRVPLEAALGKDNVIAAEPLTAVPRTMPSLSNRASPRCT